MTIYVKLDAPDDDIVLMLWERFKELRVNLSRIEDGILTMPLEKVKFLHEETRKLHGDRGINLALNHREAIGRLHQQVDLALRNVRTAATESKARERRERREAGLRDVTVWVPAASVKRLREFAKELRAEALV
ncbi:MAG: hypothetical protein ACOY9J_13415 [Pseudomonadota bacterium]|jgi:hypothetical protein